MTPLTPNQVLDALLQLQLDEQKLRAHLSRQLGVNSIDALALQHLSHAARQDRTLRIGDLRTLLAVSGAATTTIADRLERAGYLTRTITTTDRRQRNIALTDTGRDRLTAALSNAQTGIANVLSGMDDLELQRSFKLLRQLSSAITNT